MFAVSGESLTQRLRSKAFRAILRQEIGYFDEANHSTGALCTRLATEASAVQGASGTRFGFLCEHFVTLFMGTIIGFIFSWKLTLLISAFVTVMIVGSYLQMHVAFVFEKKDRKHVEDVGKV